MVFLFPPFTFLCLGMTQGCNKLNKFWNNERKCFKGEEMKIWEEEIWFERWGWVIEKEEEIWI